MSMDKRIANKKFASMGDRNRGNAEVNVEPPSVCIVDLEIWLPDAF
jgi:hypothetical protein